MLSEVSSDDHYLFPGTVQRRKEKVPVTWLHTFCDCSGMLQGGSGAKMVMTVSSPLSSYRGHMALG